MPTTTSDGYIQKVTFSIFKMVQEPDVPMRIVPVDDLYPTLEDAAQEELLSHVAEVYTRVTGRPAPAGAPQKEYTL